MPEEPVASPPPTPPSRLGFPAAFLGAVVVMAFVLMFALWRCERVATSAAAAPSEAVASVARAFKEILQLQPRVTINERVVLNQSTPLLELTVLQREVEVEREMEHTWMGSTKRVRLRGHYRVKVGFDLSQSFSVDLSDQPGIPARVSLPAPRILGVEQIRTEVLALENGLWNRITADNLGTELAALPDEAKRKAFRAGVTREAEQAIVQQLSARFPQPPGVEVKIVPPGPPGQPQ